MKTSSLPVVVAQPDERHANRRVSVLEWYDRHRAYNISFKRRRSEGVNMLVKSTAPSCQRSSRQLHPLANEKQATLHTVKLLHFMEQKKEKRVLLFNLKQLKN